ncbi:hypothetical protein CAPTEDRAFT_210718 [Capitella teleta]|uniref:Uncharacterized protein n=1 Tax=Capitella teleta TaxID=283909 RepID=R7VI87_CAPTE|nr:hypothetical protein CAPTEDRAFT_210718 [Capitella teleta]|eukprot:ELU18247.1 hypothetical protein CAPTEDRAFT_210718 [Capitella teleta]
MVERDVVIEELPQVDLLICLFHTLKVFRSQFTFACSRGFDIEFTINRRLDMLSMTPTLTPNAQKEKRVDGSPTAKRKRTSSCDLILDQVNHPSPFATGAYSSLLKDFQAVQAKLKAQEEECSQLQSALAKEKKRRLQQECKRAKSSSLLWQKKYKTMKMELSVDAEVKRLRSSLSSTRCHYRNQIKKMREEQKSIILAHKKEIEDFKQQISFLEDQLCQLDDRLTKMTQVANEPIQAKVGEKYSSSVRMAVYKALQCQWITSGHSSSVCRMARELNTYADLQAAEALLKSNNSAIAIDATELRGAHLNEVHIATKDLHSTNSKRSYLTLSVPGWCAGWRCCFGEWGD